MKNHKYFCFNCDEVAEFSLHLNLKTEAFNKYDLFMCNQCSAVSAFSKDTSNLTPVKSDYTEYNHLSKFSSIELINRSNNISIVKRKVLKKLEFLYTKDMTILDFGGGAGVFVKSCHNIGYKNTFLFEPSEALREALREVAINQLKIPENRVIGNLDTYVEKFDVITMFDVIEHLPVNDIREIILSLTSIMKDSASFLGTTPNIQSLNIILHGENDPVVAPPSHTIYFSKAVLNRFFRSLKLTKKILFTIGLSHNSFFRSHKFEHSWVERPTKRLNFLAKAICVIFQLLGYTLIPSKRGYHLFYWYIK